MPKLYIMRGIPGSGKSHGAAAICSKTKGVILSADQYFEVAYDSTASKRYIFDRNNLSDTHRYCQWRADYIMGWQLNQNVIIDNTNTTKKEVRPYVELGLKHEYEIQLVLPDSQWQWNAALCAQKCVHEVPLETIKKMLARFEMFDLDDFIKEIKEDTEIQKEISSLEDTSKLSEGSKTLTPGEQSGYWR